MVVVSPNFKNPCICENSNLKLLICYMLGGSSPVPVWYVVYLHTLKYC